MLGLYEEDESFDISILTNINAVYSAVKQIINIKLPDIIIDEETTWNTILEGKSDLGIIPTYMGLKIKMIFDPPTGSLAAGYENLIRELEFRISMIKEVK